MKILMINKNDIIGGAAKAAYRLHKALVDEGIDSFMIVVNKKSSDPRVIELNRYIWQKWIIFLKILFDRLPTFFYFNRTKTPFYQARFGISKIIRKINEINPDIVHLHWICGGMMRIEDIAKIKKPVVWTLHDNWAFTGGCHIMWECERYKTECEYCPRLGSNKKNDLSRKTFLRKLKAFSKKRDMVIVSPSKWLYECSKNSFLLKNYRQFLIPNLIDTNIFKPFDKKKARELWNLPKNKKLILFGAMNALSDVNKGFKVLTEAIHKINYKNIEIVIFGSSHPKNPPDFKFRAHYVGKLSDDTSLVTLYSAVDVTIVPSLQENLSNVIMESLACGIPIVAFNIGGNSDLIEHRQNGYLAKPFDSDDLKRGIEWILNLSQNEYNKLSINARDKIVKEFDTKIVVKKYIELYKEILNSS